MIVEQFCMICLDRRDEYKLYPANAYNMDMEFEHLTGISLQGEMQFAPRFCSECAQRLRDCSRLRDKALRAHHLLLGLIVKHETITIQKVISLSRSNNLTSSIAKKSFQPNHCDLYLTHKDKELRMNEELSSNKTINIQIESVDGRLILNPVQRSDRDVLEIFETKMENVCDTQTDVEYLKDIDDEIADCDVDMDKEDILEICEPRIINVCDIQAIDEYQEDNDSDIVNNVIDIDERDVLETYKPRMKNVCDTNQTNVEYQEDIDGEIVDNDIDTDESDVLETYKPRIKNVCDTNKTNVEYQEDIDGETVDNDIDFDVDIDIDIDIERNKFKDNVDESMNNVIDNADNDWISLKDSDSDGDSELEIVNSKAKTDNVKVTPAAAAEGKIRAEQESALRPTARVRKGKRTLKIEELLKHYKVTELSREEQLADEKREKEKRKETIYFKKCRYKCMKCFQAFKTVDRYNAHLERHTDQIGTSECPVCGVSVSGNLPRHVADCHRMRYSCRRCAFVTNRKLKALAHIGLHEEHNPESRPKHLLCTWCGNLFKSERALSIHIGWKHRDAAQNPEEPFCEECDVSFASEAAFRRHLKVLPEHGPVSDEFFNGAGCSDYMRQHTITRLTPEQQLAEVQKRQEMDNFKNSAYKCMKCFRGFALLNAYDEHMERHSDKCGPLECPACCLRFPSRNRMQVHISSAHQKRYSCKQCSFVTSHRTSARNHTNTHSGTVYTCPQCSVQHRSRSGYMLHLRVAHPNDAVCALCGYAFLNDNGLQSHMQLKHRGDDLQNLEGPLCEQCDMRFASETAYLQHLEVSPKHAVGRDKISNNSSKLLMSANPQSRRKITIACEECGEKLCGVRNYRLHFRERHRGESGRQFPPKRVIRTVMCELCGKLFVGQAQLACHMPVHSGLKQFACDVCDKRFSSRTNLITHKNVHAEVRPRYDCELCGKLFTDKSNRARHVRDIHNSSKYTCELCGKTFTADEARKNHIKHVHNGVPWPKRIRGPRRAAAARRETRARRGDTSRDARPRTRARRKDTTSDSDTQ